MRKREALLLLGFVAAGAAGSLLARVGPVTASRLNDPTEPALDRAAPRQVPLAVVDDPALVRRELLVRFDARIDAMAAQAHLDARIMLDEVLPIPYLGIDSEPVADGMRIKAVYADTGAEAAGLKPGDVVLALGDQPTGSKAALARAIRLRRVGDPLSARVRRDGKELTFDCRLRARPEEDEDEEEQFPDLPPRAPASTDAVTFTFERDLAGAAPAGFEFALGGHGRPGRWVIAADSEGHSLRQDDADATGIRFPIALVQGFDGRDVAAKLRFRYGGGRVDRAAGIVLRYRDPGNYLVARANAQEEDLRIFRVANGLRQTLPGAIGKGATNDAGWHTLEFRAEGSQLTASLDGTVVVTATDSYFLRGGVGVWTKSDSQSEFDDLHFEPLH